MYGTRDELINNDKLYEYCPRCNQVESWEHVVRCSALKDKNENFIKKLYLKLKKKNKSGDDEEKIRTILQDILNYLRQNNQYQTNQRQIGFQNLFRGIVVKNWTDHNLDYKYNKIIVYETVTHYHTCWKERCSLLHDDTIQRERLVSWHNNLCTRIQNEDKYHLKRFIENRKVNIQTAKTETIREWIRGVLKMEKITTQYHHQDIRNWCHITNPN